MASRSFDLLVYGASGFTGRLCALYLAREAPPTLRWGLAGRSAARLATIKAECVAINPALSELGIVIGDGSSPASLDEVAKSAKAIVTTVGPYLMHGEPLIAACIKAKTHYADLCGETIFTDEMIAKYGDAARSAGVILVPQAGFDSIPSDLGVLFLAEHARTTLAAELTEVRGVVVASGTASGGTVASGLGMARRADAFKARDPFLLVPSRDASALVAPLPDVAWPVWVSELKRITLPNVMAAINTRVVRRSAALFSIHRSDLALAASRDKAIAAALPTPLPSSSSSLPSFAYALRTPFAYSEVNSMPSASHAAPGTLSRPMLKAIAAYVVYSFVTGLLRVPGVAVFLSWLLPGWVLPKPGEGPSDARIARSYFNLYLLGTATSAEGGAPRTLCARVHGGDPGYGETAKMLCETGILLATRAAHLPAAAFGNGFLTPATACGLDLVRALHAKNLRFELVDLKDAPALADKKGGPAPLPGTTPAPAASAAASSKRRA